MDFEPTAEVIDKAADRFEDIARELRRYAVSLRDKKDFCYATMAASTIIQAPNQARLDLLMVRPLRAMEMDVARKDTG